LKGSEVGQQQKGLSKYFVVLLMEKCSLFVAIDKNGKVTQETENGTWWTETENIMSCMILMVL
jgi:hypothetical protein